MRKLVLQLAIIGICAISTLQTQAQSTINVNIGGDVWNIGFFSSTQGVSNNLAILSLQPWFGVGNSIDDTVISAIDSADPTAQWASQGASSHVVFIQNFSGGEVFGDDLYHGFTLEPLAEFPVPHLGNTSLGPDAGFIGTTVSYAFVNSITPVPEPTTLALAGLGSLGMMMAARRKKS